MPLESGSFSTNRMALGLGVRSISAIFGIRFSYSVEMTASPRMAA
jgi:hypothetical protein